MQPSARESPQRRSIENGLHSPRRAIVLGSQGQVLWAFGFAGLGTSCGAREATPYLSWKGCTLTILGTRQPVATHGNGFRPIEPFSASSHLPLIATGCDRSAP